MIQVFFIRLVRFLALVAFQVLLLNHIQLWGLGTPMVYVSFLLYMPLVSQRVPTLLWAFSIGLVVDVFSNTPGMSSGAMTLTAMIQPSILSLLAPRDAPDNLVPTYHTLGKLNHVSYVMLVYMVHHLAYFFIESFSFYDIWATILGMVVSWTVSVSIALALESFRHGGR